MRREMHFSLDSLAASCRVRDGSGEDQSGRWISEVGRKPTALHIPDTVAG